jgi:hypothetical protein
MKRVERNEILDLGTYEQLRPRFRDRVVEEKKLRRVGLGSNISVLFENRDTVLFQVQEMLRTERITKESGILHELETYNELIPLEGELCVTVFIEYPDSEERDRMLVGLAGIEERFYLEAGGERVYFVGKTRGDDPNRTTAVHYLRVPLGESARRAIVDMTRPVIVGVDHPQYTARTELSEATTRSLAEDLGASG